MREKAVVDNVRALESVLLTTVAVVGVPDTEFATAQEISATEMDE